jgi:hypothetical protein
LHRIMTLFYCQAPFMAMMLIPRRRIRYTWVLVSRTEPDFIRITPEVSRRHQKLVGRVKKDSMVSMNFHAKTWKK